MRAGNALHPTRVQADVAEMETYALFFQALEISVWPLLILLIATTFRVQLVQLVERVTKASLLGWEFNFGLRDAALDGKIMAKERKAAEEAEKRRVLDATSLACPDMGTTDVYTLDRIVADVPRGEEEEEEEESTLDTLMLVARHSPQAAIVQAWTEVEMAIHAVRRESLPRVHRHDVVQHLEKQGVLAETTAAQYVRLRLLRNEAAHASEQDIDATAAQTYAKLTFQLAEEIRASSQRAFDETLCSFYERHGVPSDQLVQKPALGDEFIEQYRAETGSNVERQVILDRLIYLRKRGRLPTVGR